MAVSQTLTLTQTGSSVELKKSSVLIEWKSTQTGNSFNNYTKTAYYYVSINGGEEEAHPIEYTLPQNKTVNLVHDYIEVSHRNDGTATVSVRTWMDTRISAGVIEKSKTLNLTPLPVSSNITSVARRTLGETCSVTWTPSLTNLTYRLKFSTMGWSHTTEVIKPNTTLPYTYTGYTLPLDIATNFPNKTTGDMLVALYTYSDSDGTVQVGNEHYLATSITVPENDATKPSIEMTLTPDTPCEKFSSLYLQGISKVKATFEGEGKYGASIIAYSLQAEGGRYTEPDESNAYTSNILAQSGESTIVGFVSDSRWFGNETIQKINVIAHEKPYISPSSGYQKVICERCTSDGTASESGTYLHLKGRRNYTKINTDGIENTCRVRCRYKPEGGNWSHNSGQGVDVNTSTDDFDVVLSNIMLDPKFTYVVELNISDDTGLSSSIELNIPSEAVDFELREGGKGAAFGRHSIRENTLECEWDALFNNDVSIQGTKVVDFVVEQGTSGIWEYRKWYSGKVECWGRSRASVSISTKWESIYYGTVEAVAFPVGLFTEVPMCQVTPEFGGKLQVAWWAVGGKSTNESAPSIIFCRPLAEEASFDILYYAIGNWK